MFEGDQLTDIRNLLIVTESALTILAYEESDGWVAVARFDDTTKFAEAVEVIIDYRGYALAEDDIELIVEEYEEPLVIALARTRFEMSWVRKHISPLDSFYRFICILSMICRL